MLRTLALLLLLLPSVSYADHDVRDPQGVCYFSADVTRSWANARDQGYTLARISKEGIPTKKEYAQMDPKLQAQVRKFVKKSIQLVFKDKVESNAVFETFYEWCVTTLPKETL